MAETSKLFVVTALIHGLVAALVSVLFVFPPGGSAFSLSRMIAGGSAGTWVLVGYSMYLVGGFIALTAWSYLYSSYGETNQGLSFIHLVLHNLGAIAPLLILTAGIQGGTLRLAGTPELIHNAIVWAALPSEILIGLFIIGSLIGVANVFIQVLTK